MPESPNRYTPIVGVLAVLEKDGQLLLQQRSATNRFAPGCYGLPGGHVEPGEDVVTAIQRELNEELGIQVTVTANAIRGFIDEHRSGEPARIHLVAHLKSWSGDIVNQEPAKHAQHTWVSPDNFPVETLAQAKAAIRLCTSNDRYCVVRNDPLLV